MPTVVFEMQQTAVIDGTIRIEVERAPDSTEEWLDLQERATSIFEDAELHCLDGEWSAPRVVRSYVTDEEEGNG